MLSDLMEQIKRIYTAQIAMANQYKPSTAIVSNVALLHAADSNAVISSDAYYAAIKQYSQGLVVRQVIDGDHYSMLKGNSASRLVTQISRMLEMPSTENNRIKTEQ